MRTATAQHSTLNVEWVPIRRGPDLASKQNHLEQRVEAIAWKSSLVFGGRLYC